MNSVYRPLTNSVQEELGLRGEVVIDDIVQQRDVYTTSSNISHKEHHGFPMHKFPYVDLSGSLIERAVDIGTLQTFWWKQLEIKIKEVKNSTKK